MSPALATTALFVNSSIGGEPESQGSNPAVAGSSLAPATVKALEAEPFFWGNRAKAGNSCRTFAETASRVLNRFGAVASCQLTLVQALDLNGETARNKTNPTPGGQVSGQVGLPSGAQRRLDVNG